MPKMVKPTIQEAAQKVAESDQTEPKFSAAPEPPKVPAKPAKQGSVIMLPNKLTKLGETEDFVNILFYGREGSGKTTAAASMANFGEIVIINAEGGLKKRALQQRGINTDAISVYPPPGQKVTFDGLLALYETMAVDLSNNPNAWAGIVWDSITEIVQAMLEAIADVRIQSLRNEGRDVDPWVTNRNDYGPLAKQIRHLLRRFRDLPCHFAVTALERRDVDDDTGEVAYGPMLPPSLAPDILGYVDIVLATKSATDDKPFRAASSRAGKYRAKDRFGLLPKVLNEPSFERVVDYLDGVLVEATDSIQETTTTNNE